MADTKVSALTELVTLADVDLFYAVDDPSGSPLSKKITALNVYNYLATKGFVTKVGTPVDNQIGIWTGDGTLEGDTNLTLDTTKFSVGLPIALNTSYTVTGSEPIGAIYWDTDNATFSGVLEGGVVGQFFEEAFFPVQNDTGDTLANGTVATYASSIGNSGNIRIEHTVASASEEPYLTLGLITEDITDEATGKVTTRGKVRGIQTNGANYSETWSNGDILYKSGTIAGGLTNVAPEAPIPAIPLAVVISAHVSDGTLFVRPTFPVAFTDLTDVNGTALTANGQLAVWDNDNSYFDFTENINDYVKNTDTISANLIELDEIGTATYDDVQDWCNGTQSAGIISGGDISDSGSGEIDISTVKGIVKTTNSDIGVNNFFDLTGVTNQPLTDNSTNYVAVDYNSGTPQFVIGVTNTANGHTIFNLGKVYREGTSLDIIDSGLRIYDFQKRIQQHHVEKDTLEFVSGAIVGETGTRNISIMAGIMYAGINRIATDSIDTSSTDDFEFYYYNGAAWIESDETQINNSQYNNIATGLVSLTSNRYGVQWVYKGTNSTTYVVCGQGDYTLSQAQAAQPPSSLPNHVSGFGVLRAKIIIQEGDSSFTEIESVEDESFTASTPTNHNELSNLDGGTADEYYHLTAAEYAALGSFKPSEIVADKTDDYSILTTDLGKMLTLGYATAAAKTFTLPSVGATEDRKFIWIRNSSQYTLTVTASDSDTLAFPSVSAQSIDVKPNTVFMLIFDNGDSFWELHNKTGNKIYPSQSSLYMKCNKLFSKRLDQGMADELLERHILRAIGSSFNVEDDNTYELFGGGVYDFTGAEYLRSSATADLSDFDFFGDITGDYTLFFRARHDSLSSDRALCGQYENSSNFWDLYADATGFVELRIRTGGIARVLPQTAAGIITTGNWYDYAIVRKAGNVGIYINGTLLAHDTQASNYTIDGALNIGQNGNGMYFDGRIQEVYMGKNNIFGADPDAGLTDTITIPSQFLDLVL